MGIDDTIERRWGRKIRARGIYRDPVRSSRGHFVKASGLRWLRVMLLVPIPWAVRVWALPFLTPLCPSERYYEGYGMTWSIRPCHPDTPPYRAPLTVGYRPTETASQHPSRNGFWLDYSGDISPNFPSRV